MAHRVFICHSSRDKTVADAACAALEAQDVPCWIAPRDVLGGTEYGASIIEALSSTQIVLLIFSHHSNDSPQVRREIERAVSKEKIIVPFRIEDVTPTHAMEYALSNTHWLDGMTPPLERRLSELCTTVHRLLQMQPSASVRPDGTPAAPSQLVSRSRSGSRAWIPWAGVAALLLLAAAGALGWRHLHPQPASVAATPVPSPDIAKTPSPTVDTNAPVHPSPQPNPPPHRDTPRPAEPKPNAPVTPVKTTPDIPAPPALTAAQQARLDGLETQIDALQSGAAGINTGLDNLKKAMQKDDLVLNSHWTELQSEMNLNLGKAQQALQQKDADRAERFATIAASDSKQLKTFLGH